MAEADKSSSEFADSYEDESGVEDAIFTTELGSVPRREQLVVEVGTSLAQTIRGMNEHHVGCALVVREGKLAGIFTERDVLRKVAVAGLDLEKTPVEKLMTADPDTLPPSASVAFALREMSVEGYRHIPLVNADGTPAGCVSIRDIVAFLVELFPASVLNLPPTSAVSTAMDGG
jgi:CBS domain-containing protein